MQKKPQRRKHRFEYRSDLKRVLSLRSGFSLINP